VIVGGALSWFASSNPDGLEWAMFKTSGKEERETQENVHASLAGIQEKTAFLADYGYKKSQTPEAEPKAAARQAWPAVDSGTSVSGLVGGALTIAMVVLIGLGLKRRKIAS
jgi:cobalt/nickel transport system permease protein